MSDYLPTELLNEILVKLPVKSLIRFTTVCKQWRSIITSAAFVASHLSQSKNQTLLLTRYALLSKVKSFSLLKVSENGPFCIDSSSELEFPFEPKLFYSRVGESCDGLVCLSNDLRTNPSQPTTIIWNPSVRNHLVLPEPTINPKEPHSVVLGFGVASRAYVKVVRLVYCQNSNGAGLSVPPQVEIYSHKIQSWRRVMGVDVSLRALTSMSCHAFLNRVVHWLAHEPIDDKTYRHRNSILAFDIGDEVFGEVLLPDELASEPAIMLSISVIGESLGVIKYDACGYDVWMMKEYCVKESWTKLYTIDLLVGLDNVVGFSKSGETLLAFSKLGLVAYNPKTKQSKDLGIYENPYMSFVDNHVESLLLLRGHI